MQEIKRTYVVPLGIIHDVKVSEDLGNDVSVALCRFVEPEEGSVTCYLYITGEIIHKMV